MDTKTPAEIKNRIRLMVEEHRAFESAKNLIDGTAEGAERFRTVYGSAQRAMAMRDEMDRLGPYAAVVRHIVYGSAWRAVA